MVDNSSHSTLCGDTPLCRAEVRQWVEYRTSHLWPDMGSKDLRNVLKVIIHVCVHVCVCGTHVCVCICSILLFLLVGA